MSNVEIRDLNEDQRDAFLEAILESGGDAVARREIDKLKPAAITIVIDGGGVVITNGVKLDVHIPFDCVITGWTILADKVGSATLDLWKTTFDNAPPTAVNTIVGGKYPKLTSAVKAHVDLLTDWTASIYMGDVIRVNVSSISVVTRLTLVLQVLRA